jgi:hypothetical protein
MGDEHAPVPVHVTDVVALLLLIGLEQLEGPEHATLHDSPEQETPPVHVPAWVQLTLQVPASQAIPPEHAPAFSQVTEQFEPLHWMLPVHVEKHSIWQELAREQSMFFEHDVSSSQSMKHGTPGGH